MSTSRKVAAVPVQELMAPTQPEPLTKAELEMVHAFMQRATLAAGEAMAFVQITARIESLIRSK
jgi:hypothetical protein